LYPNAKNYHLAVEIEGNTRLRYTFKVVEGATPEANADYGIRLAEVASFPMTIIDGARRTSHELRQRGVAHEFNAATQASIRSYYALMEVGYHAYAPYIRM
jgi:DNA mismatch repair ATPase MutS